MRAGIGDGVGWRSSGMSLCHFHEMTDACQSTLCRVLCVFSDRLDRNEWNVLELGSEFPANGGFGVVG